MSVSSSTRIPVSPDSQRHAFDLVVDEKDPGRSPLEVAMHQFPLAIFSSGYIRADGVWVRVRLHEYIAENASKILAVVLKGTASVRLYCPRQTAQVVQFACLDESALGTGDSIDPTLWDVAEPHLVGGLSVTVIGRRTEIIEEAVEFDGDTEKRLKYGYDSPPSEPLRATQFVDLQGQPVDRPRPVHGDTGLIRASVKCRGAMVVRYQAEYSLLRITYGLTPTDALRAAWLEAGISSNAPVWPRFRIVALASDRAATLEIEREVSPKSGWFFAFACHSQAPNSQPSTPDPCTTTDACGNTRTIDSEECKKNDEEENQDDEDLYDDEDKEPPKDPPKGDLLPTGIYNEVARVTETVRIESPDDPDQYIEDQVARVVTFVGDGGKQLVLRMKP